MSKTNTALPEVPRGVTIDYEGGLAPVQIGGHLDGVPFYFKARGKHWTVGIGHDNIANPDWFWGQNYSDAEFEAGFMSLIEARVFLFDAIERYRAGEPGNAQEYTLARDIDRALRFEPSFDELEKNENLKDVVAKSRTLLTQARAEGRIPQSA